MELKCSEDKKLTGGRHHPEFNPAIGLTACLGVINLYRTGGAITCHLNATGWYPLPDQMVSHRLCPIQ